LQQAPGPFFPVAQRFLSVSVRDIRRGIRWHLLLLSVLSGFVVAGAFGPDSLSIGADHWRQALRIHGRPKALNSNGSLSSASAGRGLSEHAGCCA